MRILVSAYACAPNSGSEPAVGWNLARELANHHDVWVITRDTNRKAIQEELAQHPLTNFHVVYKGLPKWLSWWQQGRRGERLYYHLWQFWIYFTAKRLHSRVNFDLTQHATFVKYWAPSLLSLLPVPFVWGPVGGGESAPKAFWNDFSLYGKVYEKLRDLGRWFGEHDPFVVLTARRSCLSIASTPDTAERLQGLRSKKITILSQCALTDSEIEELGSFPYSGGGKLRFISIGRLLHWKGFHLGVQAFCRANIPNAEYWIIGHGPECKRLKKLARNFGMDDRIKLFGNLARKETLTRLASCHVLVHPSLHDSGGWVCLEAMAAGKPVICLDLGGPALQVTETTGFKISAETPHQVVEDMQNIMISMSKDPSFGEQLGKAGRQRVLQYFTWGNKFKILNMAYHEVIQNGNRPF